MKYALPLIFAAISCLPPSAETPKSFAVVELFTSEGCSSCPPAEQVLGKMAAGYTNEPVYTLEFHVDYWNRLGWKDPYSKADYTKRQGDYNRLLKTETYTPQVIINGQREFLGTDKTAMDAFTLTALQQSTVMQAPGCTIKTSGQKIVLNCQADPSLAGDVIYAALVQKDVKNSVTAGENKGRILQHINVVRDMDAGIVKLTPARLVVTMAGMPNPKEHEVIVFTQQPATLQITSATRVKL